MRHRQHVPTVATTALAGGTLLAVALLGYASLEPATAGPGDVTRAEYDAVHTGMTRTQVHDRFGTPGRVVQAAGDGLAIQGDRFLLGPLETRRYRNACAGGSPVTVTYIDATPRPVDQLADALAPLETLPEVPDGLPTPPLPTEAPTAPDVPTEVPTVDLQAAGDPVAVQVDGHYPEPYRHTYDGQTVGYTCERGHFTD